MAEEFNPFTVAFQFAHLDGVRAAFFSQDTEPASVVVSSSGSGSGSGASGDGGQQTKVVNKHCAVCQKEIVIIGKSQKNSSQMIGCESVNCGYWVHSECKGFVGVGIMPKFYCPDHIDEGGSKEHNRMGLACLAVEPKAIGVPKRRRRQGQAPLDKPASN